LTNESKETQNPEIQAEEQVVSQVENAAQAAATSESHDDFDWDADEAGFETYSTDERKNLEATYLETFNPVEEKQVVKGHVMAITDKDVVVNIGFKSDGLVSRQEFRDMPDLKVGDEVEVFVDTAEDRLGQLVLSRRKALQETAWEMIVEAQENDTIVKGFVRSRTKGGLVVDVFNIDTFLPGSQIDTKPVRDYDQYVGKTMDFKIVKINEVYKNVVISHKALIEDDIEAQKSEILSKLEKGQVLEGVVKNMTSFGVFVDLGGIDGLLHITDISWERINHPEEVLKLEDHINVVILDYDDTKNRISLGLKQLTPHPWDDLDTSIEEGSKISGKVVSVADYGAFIEIKPGVEGLVHVGIKQLTQDPWVDIKDRYPVESKHSGTVKNLTSYGLFLELEEGIDGLVHVSDLSWNKKIKHPSEFVKKGETLDVIVLEVDSENRRLSLGHKQLEENPWDTFETIFTLNSEHEGTVIGINDKGATVQLQYGVEAFAPSRHIKKEDNTPMKEDEVLKFEVIEFSKDAKRIIISHTNLWKGAERARNEQEGKNREKARKNTSKNVKKLNQSSEKTTLGELDALTALRAQLEKAESTPAEKKAAPKKEAAKPVAKKEKAPKEEKSESTSAIAELKDLTGVGPAMVKRMSSLGINTVEELVAITDEQAASFNEQDSKISVEQWNKWIAEAKG